VYYRANFLQPQQGHRQREFHFDDHGWTWLCAIDHRCKFQDWKVELVPFRNWKKSGAVKEIRIQIFRQIFLG
jgi:hypothetical protein